MKVIVYRVGTTNILVAPMVAIVAWLFTHICCWGPVVLIPIGLGGGGYLLEGRLVLVRPLFYLISLVMMAILGWKTYRNSRSTRFDKVLFWISALVIVIMWQRN